MALICAKAFGATKVCITDINQSRLDLAKKVGADQTFHISIKGFNDKEFAKNLVKEFGYSPDRTIECTGAESSHLKKNKIIFNIFTKIFAPKKKICISMAIYATKTGGKISHIGFGPNKVTIPLNTIVMKELDLVGSCRIKDEFSI